MKKTVSTLLIIISSMMASIGQTTLNTGDISFLGFNSALASRDGFAFVSWVDLSAGTVIKFSDNAFNSNGSASAAGNLRNQEQLITWTSTSNILAGTVITVEGNGTSNTISNLGSVTVQNADGANTNFVALANNGDNFFAFQGVGYAMAINSTATFTGTPLFIIQYQGIGANVGFLTTGASTSSATYVPSELASNSLFIGSNAVAGEYTGPRTGLTIPQFKAAVGNLSNWTLYLNTGSPNGVNTYNITSLASSTLSTAGTLSSFSTCSGVASGSQSFTVSGNGLSSNVSITAPIGYELSSSASGTFSSSLVIPVTSGSLTNVSVFVRLSSSASGNPTGNVTLSATGVNSVNVSASGSVTPSLTPSVSITSSDQDNIICSGMSVVFTANSTNGGSSPMYQWKINGSNVANANGVTFSSTTLSNNDLVTVSLTSNLSCVTSNTVTSSGIKMSVNPLVTPLVSVSSNDVDNTICSGSSVTFLANTTNGGNSPGFQWKINGNTISGATNSSFTTANLVNNDIVTVVLTSNANCASPASVSSSGLTMTVLSSVVPTVGISTTNTTICAGAATTFTSIITNGGSTPSYQWKINGNSVSSANSSTFTTTSLANNDIVTLSLTSNASCVNPSLVTSTGITMKVNPQVVPTVSIVSNDLDNIICPNSNISFSSNITNGGTGATYQWKVNGINVNGSNLNTYSVSNLKKGDVVTVALTSNAACASPTLVESNGVIIDVHKIASVVVALNKTTVCKGDSIKLNATFYGKAPYAFHVSDGDTTISAVSQNDILVLSAVPDKSKSYILKLVSDANCVSSFSDTASVLVKNPSSLNQSISICFGETYKVGNNTYSKSGIYKDILISKNGCDSVVTTQLSVANNLDTTVSVLGAKLTSNELNAGYQWKSCVSGTIISGATNSSYTASTSGKYAVIVTKGNCSKTSACIDVVITGIDNSLVGNNYFEVFPVPSANEITIVSNMSGDYKIVNEFGQVIKTVSLNSSNGNIALIEGLNEGVYMLVGNGIFKKIIIAKK